MSLRPTTCKEAIYKWEHATGETASKAKVIELQFQWPPIEKMDATLSTLVACETLSLSSNMIEKINGIAGLKNLKILSLGKNYIKSLSGIEPLGGTLEELWISYNPIDKLKGIEAMRKLRVFHIAHAQIKEWAEFNRLQEVQMLRELIFTGNPLCEEQLCEIIWRNQVMHRLQQLTILDGIPIEREK